MDLIKKFKPFLVTGAVVLVTLAIVKVAKPKLPAFIANLLP